MSLLKDDDITLEEGRYVFNPYNPLNTKITLNDIQCILSSYGVPPKVDNIHLYERAFIHRSYTKRPAFENLKQHITVVERPQDLSLIHISEPTRPY